MLASRRDEMFVEKTTEPRFFVPRDNMLNSYDVVPMTIAGGRIPFFLKHSVAGPTYYVGVP
jgi:hypothetical protein